MMNSVGRKDSDKYYRYQRLRKARADSIAKTGEYFLEKGLPNYSYFEKRKCPVCESESRNDGYIMKNDAGNTFTKCVNCGMTYMDPVLKKEIYLRYYTHSLDTTAKKQIWDKNIEKLKPSSEPLRQTRYDLLLKYANKGRLLDFGCGFGKIADTVKFYFDEIDGIEIDSFCAHFAKEKFGLKVYNDFIENLDLESQYDACVMYNNLEHLLNPQNTLAYIHKALKPGGKLFIECPNIESISMRLFGGKHHLAQSPEHVNLFSLKTSRKLFLNNGFCILEMKTRKIDIKLNDLMVWIFKRDKFYHRCSDRFIANKWHDLFTDGFDSLLTRLESAILKLMPIAGSYCQIVASKK